MSALRGLGSDPPTKANESISDLEASFRAASVRVTEARGLDLVDCRAAETLPDLEWKT
jgi:hypothetical protein